MLAGITVSQWHNLSKSDRQKTHKSLFKMAYPNSFVAPKEIKSEDLGRLLAGM